MKKLVYLDNNATCMTSPSVRDAMMPYFNEFYGNPSSMHIFGEPAAKALKKAREQVAALLNAKPSEIIFTSCGSESNNHALRGFLESYPKKNHIISTVVEHPAVLQTLKFLEKNKGCTLTLLPVDQNGNISLEKLKEAVTTNTGLITIMSANNETGVIYPIREIAEFAAEKGILFHTDAVQAVGKIPIDLQKTPVSMLSLSGHKLHTPKGIGALYIREGVKIHPFIIGGHQESGRRAGTENIPYIVALGQACQEAGQELKDGSLQKISALRNKLEQALVKQISNTKINGNVPNRLPNTTNLAFEFVEGEAILLKLSELGIAGSTGSACASGSLDPSHVLTAMKLPYSFIHGSLRLSLSKFTTEEEIDYAIEHIPSVIQSLREMSPFYTLPK
ncbi:MAG: cysteine desulfurase NifS [Candidatus Riflebacteria bacterium]|nr:cysteine desulfurase NifS [Candidatus Riflebacteria bacterium]